MKNNFLLIVLIFFATIFIGCDGQKKEYNVRLEDDGVLINEYLISSNQKIEFPTITKNGYTFAGVYKDSAFTIKWDLLTDVVTDDITLYIKWEINKYKLEVDGKKTEVEYGKIIDLDEPKKEGYTFVGWYLDKNYNTKWNNEAITQDTTLYSKFEINKYTVVLDGEEKEVEFGSTLSEYIPTKEGHSFIGWYLDRNYENKWDDNIITYNVVLYSKFEKNKYTVKFDESNIEDQIVKYGELVNRPNDLEMEGYIFVGWCKDKSLKTIWDFNNDKVKRNITLYAKFEKIKFNVKFEGSNLSDIQVGYNEKITQPNDPIKSEYKFLGWYKDNTLETIWNFEDETVISDVILYAKWEFVGPKGLEYKLNSDESSYSVSSYNGTALKMIIPAIYQGLPVTSIGDYAFQGCTSLTNVVIPNSVTSIGKAAFANCESVITIEIPSSVIKIDDYAFQGCISLTNIVIPNSVTSIGKAAFANCESVRTIEIPDSVIKIDDYAFQNCKSLKSIVLPKKIQNIGESLFKNCTSLTNILIPSSVKNIGRYALSGCTSLKSITLPFVGEKLDGTENKKIGYIFGWENNYNMPESLKEVIITGGTSISSSAFENCKFLTNIVIPNSVTSIGEGAFSNCTSLESITLPFVGEKINETENTEFGYIFGENVPSSLKEVIITGGKNIGSQAFRGCKSLTSIVIPNSVTSIDSKAFSGCTSLTSIVIPNSVTSIDSEAFRYCKSLTSIIIPNSVTSIGDLAFYDCESLNNVYYEGTIEDWCNIKLKDEYSNPMCCANHFYMKDSNNEYQEVTEIVIPNTITKISEYQFYGFTNVKSIKIHRNFKDIKSLTKDKQGITISYYD